MAEDLHMMKPVICKPGDKISNVESQHEACTHDESAATHLCSLDALQDSPSELGSPGSPERSLGLRTFVRSFSAGSRGYEKMHNAKQNMKQLLMPWKRKNRENDEEEVQSNDDFGTHPVLQVSIKMSNCGFCVMPSGQANALELAG